MNGPGLRHTVLVTVALCAALTFAGGPAFAQTAPESQAWLSGPDAVGANSFVGRIETPTRTQNVASGASVLVSGWAADTSATGWSGIDGVEVWSGSKDQDGIKLISGNIGLARSDISDLLGASFGNSGFSAVVPSGALKNAQAMAANAKLFVYIHTPGKGTWYQTTTITLVASLPFPTT